MTMMTVNTLLFAKSIAQIEKVKHVVWFGAHIHLLPYQQMAQHWFSDVQKTVEGSDKAQLMFPRYSSFLGSLGLLLTQTKKENEQNLDDLSEEEFPDVSIQVTKTKKRRKRTQRKENSQKANSGGGKSSCSDTQESPKQKIILNPSSEDSDNKLTPEKKEDEITDLKKESPPQLKMFGKNFSYILAKKKEQE